MIENNVSKFIIGVQARSTSVRIPGKVLLPVGMYKFPMWYHTYLKCVHTGLKTIMLIPDNDTKLVESLNLFGVRNVMFGPESSPLERYLSMVKIEKPDYFIRVTADCPLVSTEVIMDMANETSSNRCDYVQYSIDGFDVQIASSNWFTNGTVHHDKEHVFNIDSIMDYGIFRSYRPHLSIDTKEDYERISKYMKDIII